MPHTKHKAKNTTHTTKKHMSPPHLTLTLMGHMIPPHPIITPKHHTTKAPKHYTTKAPKHYTAKTLNQHMHVKHHNNRYFVSKMNQCPN